MSIKINKNPDRTVPGGIASVEMPSTSMPRDYQLRLTAGRQGDGKVKLEVIKFGSESTGSIHVTLDDLEAAVATARDPGFGA